MAPIPGSRSLRIGKASGVNQNVCSKYPNVILRKSKETALEPAFSEGICRRRNKKRKPQFPAPVKNCDKYAITAACASSQLLK